MAIDMEPIKKDAKSNPSATANLFSQIFFCWLNPLFRIGSKRRLEEDDMYKVLPEDGSKRLGEELQRRRTLGGGYREQGVRECEALCLSATAMGQTTTGQIVNLLSNDVSKFDEVTIFLHFLWVGPLQAAAVIGLLWQEIGASCLAGMAVLIFLMPLQTMFGKLFSKYRSKTAAFTDNRIRTMNEVVSGIRIIKMYAWEKPFAALVNDVRRKEISKIMSSSYLRGLNMASFFTANKIILFVTFTVYVLVGNTISASRVFVAVSLYSAVRLTVTLFFPAAIEKVSESAISIRRIKKFLLLDELVKSHVPLTQEDKKEASVEIQDLICYWDKTLDAPTLQNVSFNVKPGQLLAVIGPVGAGKSSLLSTVLGELPAEKGVIKVKGELTYASQQPWVFPGTIQSNILFGKELQPQRYESVLRACALKRDMELLPDGDLTVIGDRGATLSGGQKARVNLARAVYQDADIYLLDDPLSAVDAEVGRHLFEQATEQEKLDFHSSYTNSSNGTNGTVSTNTTQELNLNFYLGIYAGLTGATIIFGFMRSLFMFNALVSSAETLHNRMFNSILRTPVRFFDINPVGEYKNTKDFLYSCLFIKLGSDQQRAAHPVKCPLGNLSILCCSWKTSVDVQLLPEERKVLFVNKENPPLHRFFHSEASLNQFVKRLCLVLTGMKAGDVGLALSYAVTLMGMFQWGVRQSAEVENMMTSVERVIEYTELESEAPWETQKRPPPDWPNRGLITFDRVNFSYSSDGPVVLKNISAMFRPREKVGIVGRTGAGKSSLISALFRLMEPEGKIIVDRVLTSEIGLHDLRQKMSIIPQDPVLFTGTMRKNLDPFTQHSDHDLWNTLEEVQLKAAVEELPNKLETELAESGSNFSMGQRQLVCLARAILRKNRILIIDEATANVDPRTDELIQKTIRDKFKECTVLTIAHRLNTIIDSDRILVLDAGRIHEYDAPHVLLQNQNGIFYKMVQQTGKAEAASLLQTAKQAYMNRSPVHQLNGFATTGDGSLIIFETAL
ncbi:multidrug resistance-associated protein 4-like [Sinocyclocheilus grahami]|uniref:multidrug resistance-associated protein 4-like n=1 Tax=Sinocyclocheilus grahami TaxID=75366 RepID=UPI0007AC7405|nr:PREDICTED: multidrug resistance-associated protein 4-like [Sinocyclocheilus grahami]